MRKFSAVAHIKDLNELKVNMTNSFLDSEEFRLKLKSCGLPSNVLFWTFFKSSGIIKRRGKSSYGWADASPIHYTVLQAIYREYQKKVNHYAKTRQEKVKRCENSTRIKKAISLLKEHGYKIWETHNGYFKEIQCYHCVKKLRQQQFWSFQFYYYLCLSLNEKENNIRNIVSKVLIFAVRENSEENLSFTNNLYGNSNCINNISCAICIKTMRR